MRLTTRLLFILVCLLPCLPAAAETGAAFERPDTAQPSFDQQWFGVYLNEQRVGTMSTRRVASDSSVLTFEKFNIQLGRSGTVLAIHSEQRIEEGLDGRPLGFTSRTDAAGSISEWEGRVDRSGRLSVAVKQGNAPRTEAMAWPRGALLSEGLRLAQLKRGFAPGTRYSLKAFDIDSLTPYEMAVTVEPAEQIEINGLTESLVPLHQDLHFERGSTESTAWVRPDGSVRRIQLSVMGLDMQMIACDQPCAKSPLQDTDVLDATLVVSPEPLTLPQRHRALRFELAVDESTRDDVAALGSVPGQTLTAIANDADRFHLLVDPEGAPLLPPTPADLRATRWLQSDDDAIKAFAGEQVDARDSAASRMMKLERGVRKHISNKSLRVGYASALETLSSREGDCTEHAVLLAAAARASGIPARVVTGLVYSDQYAGRRDVFIPHAWVQAWVDGRWRGYDAALNGMDAGHIGLGVGDGDPYRYYQGMALLGHLTILGVTEN